MTEARAKEIEQYLSLENRAKIDGGNHRDVVPALLRCSLDLLDFVRGGSKFDEPEEPTSGPEEPTSGTDEQQEATAGKS